MSYVRSPMSHPDEWDSRAEGNPEFGIGGQAPPKETFSTQEQLENETLTIKFTGDHRLMAIAHLRSEMAVMEQPGDEFINYCLDEDVRIVESGGNDELIATTYPELPDRIRGLVEDIDAIEEEFEKEIQKQIAQMTNLGEAHKVIDSILKDKIDQDLQVTV